MSESFFFVGKIVKVTSYAVNEDHFINKRGSVLEVEI
jgi:hypothetical protein